jgi:hypothetical protein
MMSGKSVVILILAAALGGGALMFVLQVYAFYTLLGNQTAMTVVPADGGEPIEVPVVLFKGIDAQSSPIRYRACFDLPDPAALADAAPVARPTPLVAPGWFDCFDAGEITRALEAGQARAVLSVREVAPGVDRIIAYWPDGRAVAWHQLNGTLEN